MTRSDNAVSGVTAKRGPAADQAALLIAALGAIFATFDMPPTLAALGVTALVVLPSLVVWISRRTLLIADPIILLGIAWILAVATPILVPGLYFYPAQRNFSSWSFDTAALWMLRAWVAISFAYWAARFVTRSPRRPPAIAVDTAAGYRMRVFVGLTGFVSTIVFIYLTGAQDYSHLDFTQQTSSILQASDELQRFSILYVFLYFNARGRRRLRTSDHVLLALVLAAQGFLLSASATKLIGIQLIAAFLLGSAAGGLDQGKVLRQVAFVAAATLLTYFVFSFITAYRIELEARVANVNASLSDAISQQIASAESAAAKIVGLEEIPAGDRDQYRSMILDRVNQVTSFARLLNYTGPDSPYENSYASLMVPMYAFLPRDLMGEKVQFFGSGDFARLLGWRFGGLSISTPGSFFWAWGFEGIVPGMMALGLLLGLLSRGAERAGRFGLVCQLLEVQFVISLLDVGTDFQSVIVNLTRSLIVFLAFLFLTSSSRQQRSSPSRRPADGTSPGGNANA